MIGTWEEHRALRMRDAENASIGSPCGVKIGAVLENPSSPRLISGCNQPPTLHPRAMEPAFADCREWCPRRRKAVADKDSGYTDCPTVHAEMVVLARAGTLAACGAIMYVTGSPCRQCAKMIAWYRVAKLVVSTTKVMSQERHLAETVEYLEACGVFVEVMEAEPEGVL